MSSIQENAAHAEQSVSVVQWEHIPHYERLKDQHGSIILQETLNDLLRRYQVEMLHFDVKRKFDVAVGFRRRSEKPLGLAAGSLAVGAVQLFANVALVEGAMKRSRGRLLVWEAAHSLLLAAYAAAAAALWAALLGAEQAPLPVLRRLCPQVAAALLVLLTVHGGLQVYALIVVESLRRKFLRESPPPSLDIAYQKLERY